MSKNSRYGFCFSYFDPKMSFSDKVKASMKDYQEKFKVIPLEVNVNYSQYSAAKVLDSEQEILEKLPIKITPEITIIFNNFLVFGTLNE